MNELQPEERETHFNMTGDDHQQWTVFTDDPYWIRRLDKITIGKPVGNGKEYTLRADQVLVRTGKKQLSDEAKAAMGQRLQESAKNTSSTGVFNSTKTKPVHLDIAA